MRRAFTLIELLVTMGIFAIVISTGLVVYTQTIGKTDLRSEAALLAQTLHQAQWQAASGKSIDGNNPSSYGVHFENNRYILFSSDIYNPEAADNIETRLPDNITLSFNLPDANLVFDAKTGLVSELDAFGPGQVTLAETGGTSKTLTISRFGVVDIN